MRKTLHPLPHSQNHGNKHKRHPLPPPPSLLPLENKHTLKDISS